MDLYITLIISAIIAYVSPQEQNIQIIRKCCAKGMQLSTDTNYCVPVEGTFPSNEEAEIFYPPISKSDVSWLPNELRSNIVTIHYQTLPNVELDVSLAYACNNGTVRKIRDSPRKIDQSLISIVRFCYDSTPTIRRVLVKGIRLKSIHKCCSKGERLNSKATACEPKAKYPISNSPLEGREQAQHHWLPGNYTASFLKIKYNFLQSGYRFTSVVPVNSEFKWKVLKSEPSYSTLISYQGHNVHGNPISDITDIFCFDEVSDGPLPSRVLLAGGFHVPKCCGRGEELDDGASACTVRKGRSRDKDKCGVLDAANDVESYWLPKMFHGHVPVRYEMIFKMSLHSSKLSIIGNEDSWRMKPDNIPNISELILEDSSSKQISVEEMHYCFDYLKGYGKVVVMHHLNDRHTVENENSREEILFRYLCDKRTGNTITPTYMLSMNRTIRQPIESDSIILPLESYCKKIYTDIYQGISTYSVFQKSLEKPEEWWTVENNVKNTVPSCSFSNLRYVANLARQVLGIASAVLAAAGALLAGARKALRSTAHGRALCCHAFCVCMYTSLHVATFYHTPTHESGCLPYLYISYFFMMSSYFWLTAITFNIYLTFRKPLGELAMTLCKTPKEVQRRFIMLSLLGWGGGMAFTALSIIMHQLKSHLRPMGVITPTFFETHTCEYEFEFSMDEDNGSFMFANVYSVASYHCGPMALLTLIDAGLLLLITRHLHKLRRGRSVLHCRRSSQVNDSARSSLNPFWQSAFLYAKLLLVSGIADVGIGAATWATNLQEFRFYVLDETIVLSKRKAYTNLIMHNAVDLIRALCVFWMSTGKLWSWDNFKEWNNVIQFWKRGAIQKIMKFSYKEGTQFHGNGRKKDIRKISSASNIPLSGIWKKLSFK